MFNKKILSFTTVSIVVSALSVYFVALSDDSESSSLNALSTYRSGSSPSKPAMDSATRPAKEARNLLGGPGQIPKTLEKILAEPTASEDPEDALHRLSDEQAQIDSIIKQRNLIALANADQLTPAQFSDLRRLLAARAEVSIKRTQRALQIANRAAEDIESEIFHESPNEEWNK